MSARVLGSQHTAVTIQPPSVCSSVFGPIDLAIVIAWLHGPTWL